MSKTITIGSDTYELPTQGQSPKWGTELSDIIEKLADSVNVTQGPSDITETSANIANSGTNVSVTGYIFSSSSVRSFDSSYNVSRTITKSISSISGDGATVTVDCAQAHDLKVGDNIVISGTVAYNGAVQVSAIVDSDSFQYSSATTGSEAVGNFNIQLVEEGVIRGKYNQNGWTITQEKQGEANLDFNIDDSTGQITYTPTTLQGSGYSGLIKFLGKAVLNT